MVLTSTDSIECFENMHVMKKKNDTNYITA